MARHPVQATGRLMLYGSTRYTAQGSKKKYAALKGAGTHLAGSVVGTMVGGAAGAALSSRSHDNFHSAHITHTASNIGGIVGSQVGNRMAAKHGYIRRDKQRMSLRATHASFGKADRRF